MSSPREGDYDHRTVDQTLPTASPACHERSPAPEGNESDHGDLVTRALAILEREQRRWQMSRSAEHTRGSRS